MKLLFLIVVAVLIATAVYLFSSFEVGMAKKSKKFNWKSTKIASIIFVVLLGVIAYGVYSSDHQPDSQCTTTHKATSKPSVNLNSASDYYNQGNYDYDFGNCQKAVSDYSKAIALNPNYAQAYNNRAYTNMRIRKYKDALSDLDKAIALNPNYVQALMNRGDIHNYYYQIDRQAAIADYKRVITLTGPRRGQTSVCGHLFLAKHNGWTPGAYIDFFTGAFRTCE